MSYSTKELSASDGSPIELFMFNVGGQFWYFTSQTVPYTYLGNEYTPVAITRDNPRVNQERSSVNLTVRLPADAGPPMRYIDLVPTSKMSMTIFRAHRTDGGSPEVVTFWKGFILNVSFNDNVAEMVGTPIQSLFGREIPRQTYQGLCNHVLYDTGCQVAKAAFSDDVQVTSITSGGSVLVLNSLSTARPADTTFFTGGIVERSNGDKRLIMSYTFATDTVRILLPFQDLVVGEVVTARAGCNRSLDACLDKFDNVLRFDGFPMIPGVNPFEHGF